MNTQDQSSYITKRVIDREGRKSILTWMLLPGHHRRQLRIETSKMYDRPGVATDAIVVTINDHGFSHIFGCGLPGSDFRMKLRREPGLRATEKALQTQHAAMVEALDFIVSRALAHYAAQQPKEIA